jgi:hypothetical protein
LVDFDIIKAFCTLKRRVQMPIKRFLVIGLYLGLSSLLGASVQSQDQIIIWATSLKTAEAYFNYPSTENALRFYNNLPASNVEVAEIKDTKNFLDLIDYLDNNLPILSHEMKISDRNAVKVAFRLMNISDGTLAESLDAALGDLIRINPRMFLEELLSCPNRNHIKEIGYPVTSGGLYYVGQWPQVEKYELEMRVKALGTVKDPDLLGIRDICIAIIEDELGRISRSGVPVTQERTLNSRGF